MLQKFKRFSAKKPVEVFLKGNRPEEISGDKVGIILDLDLMDREFSLGDFRKEMAFPYETFYPIVCSEQKPIPEKYSLEEFDAKHLDWNATFEIGSKEQLFQETSFGLLLNYFVEPSPELLILSASVKARLKVGFPLEEKRLNDLEIKVDPKDYKLFALELKKYLAVIDWTLEPQIKKENR